jgi:hypothetical protein
VAAHPSGAAFITSSKRKKRKGSRNKNPFGRLPTVTAGDGWSSAWNAGEYLEVVMILCDLCGQAKECLQREIDGKEFDICSDCWLLWTPTGP